MWFQSLLIQYNRDNTKLTYDDGSFELIELVNGIYSLNEYI